MNLSRKKGGKYNTRKGGGESLHVKIGMEFKKYPNAAKIKNFKKVNFIYLHIRLLKIVAINSHKLQISENVRGARLQK